MESLEKPPTAESPKSKALEAMRQLERITKERLFVVKEASIFTGLLVIALAVVGLLSTQKIVEGMFNLMEKCFK